jgi:hypothetical protein
MMNWVVFLIVGVVLVIGIEYISRGFQPPWRQVTLGVVVVVLILWLLGLAGVVPLPLSFT